LVASFIIFSGFVTSIDNNKGKPFKALITYDITYSGDIDAATLASQPKDMIVKILGNKSRQEVSGSYIIIDGDTKTSYVLIDIMDKKYALKTTKEDIDKELNEGKVPVIKYIDGETKEIAGYLCKKAEFIETDEDSGEEIITTVFYTDAFGSEDLNFGGQFHGLKGWPMEYELTMYDDDITIKYTARLVDTKAKISDADFLIPEDYQITTREKLLEIFGGME
jgi:hypothetical protein